MSEAQLTASDLDFLDQFEVTVEVVAYHDSGLIRQGEPIEEFVHIPVHRVVVTMKVKELLCEVVVPDKIGKEGLSREVGFLVLEKTAVDLMEGMTTALHKVRPEIFPTHKQYLAYLDKQKS